MSSSDNKYYVVWIGLNPGIYNSWEECRNQVEGWKGAIYKGFKTKGIKSDLPNKEKSRINQNFIQLPISKFKNKIKELCSKYNIKYMEINESYTSICSFYDNEEIKYHRNYLGKRMTRSLFKTKEGKIINADINGALNILKKGKPDRTDIISFLRNIGQTVPIRQKIKL